MWLLCVFFAFSALTLLVGRQEGHPACKKLEWWGTGVVICLERGADLHMTQRMPLPLTVSCFSKIQIGFVFLVPACSPGQRAVDRVCVCVFLVPAHPDSSGQGTIKRVHMWVCVIIVCTDFGEPVLVIPWVVLQELDFFKHPKQVTNCPVRFLSTWLKRAWTYISVFLDLAKESHADRFSGIGEESVPKIIINDTISFFNCNQDFANF